MRLTPTFRLVAIAFLVFLAAAATWWIVGYQIGKGLLDEMGGGSAWRAQYGLHEGGAAQLLFLAVVGALALVASGAAQGASRFALLGALGLGAALVDGSRGGALAGMVLYVLATAAVDEAEGRAQPVAAVILGFLVAFAYALDAPFSAGQAALAVLLRGVCFFLPLLWGPHLVDRLVLGRAERLLVGRSH